MSQKLVTRCPSCGLFVWDDAWCTNCNTVFRVKEVHTMGIKQRFQDRMEVVEQNMPAGVMFCASRFFARHGDLLEKIDGLTDGEAIDVLVSHGIPVSEAKPLVMALIVSDVMQHKVR